MLDSDTLNFLKEIVAISSFSEDIAGVNRAQDVLAERFSSLGLYVTRIPQKTSGDHLIISTSKNLLKDHVVLLGHADTVHKYDSSFSSLIVKDGFGYGPGAYDMKGGLATIYLALKTLKEKGKLESIPLNVVINADEENGDLSDFHIFEDYISPARSVLVFECGRPADGVLLERKGVGNLVIKVKGKSAHAGNEPEKGANAITQIADTILKICAVANPDKGTTISPGIIEGGEAINTVAASAIVKFDLRATAVDEFSRIEAEIKKIISSPFVTGTDIEIQNLRYRPPLEKDERSILLFEKYKEAAAKAGLKVEMYPRVGGGSDGNYTSAWWKVPTIDGVGPFGYGAHTREERVELDSIVKKADILVKFLE